MLVLARRQGKRVRVQFRDASGKVLATCWVSFEGMLASGGQARIGFVAPASVEIYREEMLDEGGQLREKVEVKP